MKESSFINQNKENWKHYEDVLKGKSHEPDELNDLFIQVTDDLSYSRSFYPNRSVRVYLNNLAQKIFLKLYTNRKRKQSFLIKFFKDELPAIMYAARKEMLVCFLIFVLTFMVGVFSSRHQAGFAREILGDTYVDMTNENIKAGKPMNVYSEGDKLTSFFRIARNNLQVDLLTFVTGLIFGIGSLFVLAYNGVMVGVFQYFFYGSGYLTFTILTIWLHGTLEIFCMILSATAGLVFGKGLIAPGTYSRSQAFRISAVKGVKILFVVIPLTLIAAFIESFITGQSQSPLIFKAGLILISLGLILFYFVWFPYRRFSNTGLLPEENELPAYKVPELVFDDIKTVGEVVADTFRIWKKYLSSLLLISLVLSSALVGSVYGMQSHRLEYHFFGFPNNSINLIELLKINYWFRDGYYILWPAFILVFSLFAVYIQSRFFKKHIWINLSLKTHLTRLLACWFILILSLGTFYFFDGFWWFMFYFFIGFPLSISFTSNIFDNGLSSIGNGISWFFKTFFPKLLLNLSLLILMFIVHLIVSSRILNFIFEVVSKGLRISDPMLFEIEKLFVLTIGLTTLFALISLYIYGNTLHYFSSKEKITAQSLKIRLEKIWS